MELILLSLGGSLAGVLIHLTTVVGASFARSIRWRRPQRVSSGLG